MSTKCSIFFVLLFFKVQSSEARARAASAFQIHQHTDTSPQFNSQATDLIAADTTTKVLLHTTTAADTAADTTAADTAADTTTKVRSSLERESKPAAATPKPF